MALPSFIVIHNDPPNRYLRQVYNIDEPVELRGFLRYSGEEFINPHSKFEVEPADVGGGLVHIRCCYNNNYWVGRQNQHWIVAEGHEKEEDPTRWSCTLFSVEIVGDHTVRLRHVFHNQIVRHWDIVESPENGCLYAGIPTETNILSDTLTYTDWESVPILPRHIAIRGDNGLYLGARPIDGSVYLEFNCENREDERVGNQVFTTPHGCIRIKSDFTGNFWRRSPNWIWPDSDDMTDNNFDTVFKVTRNDDDNTTIALRNIGNNFFCKRHTGDGRNDCLHASAPNINVEETELHVEELVTHREVFDVSFNLPDVRFYDEILLATLETITLTNLTQTPTNHELHFAYTKEKTQIWNASISWKLGVNTLIRAHVPYIENGTTRLAPVVPLLDYQWGETITTETTVDKTYPVQVPPMTRITVSLLASKATCDIPYAYSQRDTLINEEEVIYTDMNDGLYTFTDTYDFICEPSPMEPI